MINKKEYFYKMSETLVFRRHETKPEENYVVANAFSASIQYKFIMANTSTNYNMIDEIFDTIIDDTNSKMKKANFEVADKINILYDVFSLSKLSVEDRKAFL